MTTPPQGPQLGECRSCGAAIRWAHTAKGHRIPLNVHPSPDGNLIIEAGVRGRPTAVSVPPEGSETERYTSHFATCPHAAQHRHRARAITRQGAEA